MIQNVRQLRQTHAVGQGRYGRDAVTIEWRRDQRQTLFFFERREPAEFNRRVRHEVNGWVFVQKDDEDVSE